MHKKSKVQQLNEKIPSKNNKLIITEKPDKNNDKS